MRSVIAAVVLVLTAVEARAYECDYRRVSLKDRSISIPASGPTMATTALVEKGMTGVVDFMAFDGAGHPVYRMRWDAALVLTRIYPPNGGHALQYYYPTAGITEGGVLKSDTAEPSITCRE